MAPDTRQERFADRRVRQALAYALDRDAMIAALYKGYANKATGPISPALSFYYTDDVTTYPYDPDKAGDDLPAQTAPRALLDAGRPFTNSLSIDGKGHVGVADDDSLDLISRPLQRPIIRLRGAAGRGYA